MTRRSAPFDYNAVMQRDPHDSGYVQTRRRHALDEGPRDLDAAYRHLYGAMDHLHAARAGKIDFDSAIYNDHVTKAADCLKGGGQDEAEEEEAAKEGENGEPVSLQRSKESTELRSLHYKSTNVNSKASRATSAVAPNGTDPSTVNCGATLERNGTQTTPSANAETVSVTCAVMEIPKTFVAVEDLSKYSIFRFPFSAVSTLKVLTRAQNLVSLYSSSMKASFLTQTYIWRFSWTTICSLLIFLP